MMKQSLATALGMTASAVMTTFALTVVASAAINVVVPPEQPVLSPAPLDCETDAECEALTGIPLEWGPIVTIRLVGIGCEGTIGEPLYAEEEDHFPRCKEIRPIEPVIFEQKD